MPRQLPQHYYKLLCLSRAASHWLSEAGGPAVHRGEWTDGGMVRRRDGEMVSCHLTEPNYKTTQPCAHSWGARAPVTGGKIDDVSVTRRGETHPDITATLSAHVKKGNMRREVSDGPTCPHANSNMCQDVKIIQGTLKTQVKHKPYPPV